MALLIKPKLYVMVGFLIWSLAYLLVDNFHREDWRSLTKNLQGPTYMIRSKSDPIIFYGKSVKDLEGEIKEDRIEVIPYGSEIAGFDYENKLAGYQKAEEKSFRQVNLEVWYK